MTVWVPWIVPPAVQATARQLTATFVTALPPMVPEPMLMLQIIWEGCA